MQQQLLADAEVAGCAVSRPTAANEAGATARHHRRTLHVGFLKNWKSFEETYIYSDIVRLRALYLLSIHLTQQKGTNA